MTITSADVIRAAVYQRVSSNQQNDRRQDYENDQAVERYGWQATRYREPRGVSASRFGGKTREVWNAIRGAIITGQIDVVVLHEVSRGQRRLTGWSEVLDACRQHQVRIYITSRDRLYDVSRADDWEALATDGIRSAMESETLSTRIRSGKDEGMREGRPQGSVPYGIHRVRDPEKAKWAFLYDEPHPVTGPVVARIIREVGNDVPFGEIAAGLDRDGVPVPTAGGKREGKRWHPTTVARIAGSAYYASPAALEGYPVRPVVTAEESERAIRRVRDNQRKGERVARQEYRYSQILACGRCGSVVRAKVRHGRALYVCGNGHGATSAALVDDYIDRLAIGYLTDPELVAMLTRKDTSAVAAAARAEAAGHRQKIREATDSYNRDKIGIDELEDIRAYRKPKAEAADKRAADAERPAELAGLAGEERKIVAARWAALSTAGRKAALRIIAPDAQLMPAGRGPTAAIEQRIILWPQP
jgi:site-specific DNA recombinase